VFCSRHGDVARALALLNNVVDGEPMSPTNFGLAVHNANAGLFSIARQDQASHIALAGGSNTVEHGVIEACSLLADGAEMVLLVVYDNELPPVYQPYQDCQEQAHAWAWLMAAPSGPAITLRWSKGGQQTPAPGSLPASLQVWKFFVNQSQNLDYVAQQRQWCWSRHG